MHDTNPRKAWIKDTWELFELLLQLFWKFKIILKKLKQKQNFVVMGNWVWMWGRFDPKGEGRGWCWRAKNILYDPDEFVRAIRLYP